MKKKLIILLIVIALIFTTYLLTRDNEEVIEPEQEIVQEEEIVEEEVAEEIEEEIACENSFVDPRDEQEYCFIEFGEQVWMSQNLNYDNDCSQVEWRETKDKGWCGCYDYEDENCEIYGKLYQWSAATDICPEGWHLPSDTEWGGLMTFLGSTPGTELRVSGFNSLPGGSLTPGGLFQNIDTNAYFWSADESNDTRAWSRHLITNQSGVYRLALEKAFAFSVRCIQD
jgi:uncharacterized protein (TIGR02145 family)